VVLIPDSTGGERESKRERLREREKEREKREESERDRERERQKKKVIRFSSSSSCLYCPGPCVGVDFAFL